MAQNIFDPSKIYSTRLFGHGFNTFPECDSPVLPGTFAADTVEADGKEYAVFTVQEPTAEEFPKGWIGVYRIDMVFLAANPPVEIGTVPEPDPDPDPDPDDPSDPDTPEDPDTPGEDDNTGT